MSRKTSVFILVWGYDQNEVCSNNPHHVEPEYVELLANCRSAADELNWFRIENTENFKWTEHFWIVLYPNNEDSQKNIRRDVKEQERRLAILAHSSSAPIIDWHYNKFINLPIDCIPIC